MTKIAIALDPNSDYAYPIYRNDGRYQIDLGGATGMSDPIEFPNDVTAINWFRDVVERDSDDK